MHLIEHFPLPYHFSLSSQEINCRRPREKKISGYLVYISGHSNYCYHSHLWFKHKYCISRIDVLQRAFFSFSVLDTC
jgi:hypothetical protein